MNDFLNKPYSVRQFVVVERDEIIQAKQIMEAKKIGDNKNDNNEEKNFSFSKVIVEITNSLMVPPSVILVDLILKAIEKQKELSRKINVNYISFTESVGLKFPIGHPRENELYVAHPILQGVYYPINDFHKKVFEHKFAELNSLLMNLGAKKVDIQYIHGWDFESNNQLDVPKIKAKVGTKLLKGKKFIYTANYKNNTSLKLPDNLAWYHFEPTWQSVGEGRLNHDLQDFNLLLEYKDDFGINTDLHASVSKIGFGTKNSFNKQESTVWKVIGEF